MKNKLSPSFLLPILTFALLCSGTHPPSKPVAIFYLYRALLTDHPSYDAAFHEFSRQTANFVDDYNETVQEKRDVYGCVMKLAKSIYGPYCRGPPGNGVRNLQPIGFGELVDEVTEDHSNVREGVAYGQFDNVVKSEYYNIQQQLEQSQPELLDNVIPVFVVLTGYMLDAELAEAATQQADLVRSKGGHVFLVHIIFSELSDWKREQLETARKEFERIADGYYELLATDISSVSEQIAKIFARMQTRLQKSIGQKTLFTGMIDVHSEEPSISNDESDLGNEKNEDSAGNDEVFDKLSLQNPENPQIDVVVPQDQGQPVIVSQPDVAQPAESNEPELVKGGGRQASKHDDRKDHQNIAININIKTGESQKQSKQQKKVSDLQAPNLQPTNLQPTNLQQKPSELPLALPQSPMLTAPTPPSLTTSPSATQSAEQMDVNQPFPQPPPEQPTPITPIQQPMSSNPKSSQELLPQPAANQPPARSDNHETIDETSHNIYLNLARSELANSTIREQHFNTTDSDPSPNPDDESIHWVVIAMAVMTIIILFIAVVNLAMVKRGDTRQTKQPLPLPETPNIATPENRRY